MRSEYPTILYYDKAVDHSYANGMYEYGMVLKNKDSKKAQQLLKSAADKGHRQAASEMASLQQALNSVKGRTYYPPQRSVN